ncbi:hypothetical protein [Selenomonas ruminantium]|uniref:Autotransporter domain-containing protein n=1 Tax=Selenomonas ruminantium TaxID=971 RepID=A0A1H0SCP2_SELRU|nr:hypothetical protein [Selenomonas ruminantium]SDP38936.1 hypothetical protein SAMN05216366_11654 [Selenomonas ruminantium]
MKGKPTQEIIRPAAYDSEAASHSGIMQRLSGGGHLYVQTAAALTAVCSVQGAMLPMQVAQAETLPDGQDSLTLDSTTSQTENTITVNSGGTLNVNSGGTASNTTVSSGGTLNVSGGTLVNTIINENPWIQGYGYLVSVRAGTLTSTTINSGGEVYANISETNSGTLTSTTINSGGRLVVSGGTLNGVNLSGGTLTFYGCTISGTIQGYGALNKTLWSSGGTLIVSGGNITMSGGYNYKPDRVIIEDNLRISGQLTSFMAGEISLKAVDATTPVLYFTANSRGVSGGIITFDKLNVTNFNAGTATSGTLIAVDNNINDNSGATLTSGTTNATLTAANPSYSFLTGEATPYTPSTAPALTLMTADATTFTLVNNGTTESPKLNRLDFSIGPQVSQATFSGTVAWNPASAYYTNSGGSFANTTSLDLSNLQLDFTSATTAEALGSGTTMTLLGGGNIAGTITQPTAINSATYAGTNADYTANLSGEGSLSEGNLIYGLTGATVTGVKLKQVSDNADVLPTGWAAGNTTIDVDTSHLTLPTNLAAGTTKDIFSLEGASYNLTGSNVFDTATTPLSTGENGVTLSGTKTGGGVRTKANATSTLEYVAPADKINQATIGEITWANSGTVLDASSSANNFASLTADKVDTTGFKITNPTAATADTTMTLLAGNDTLADFDPVSRSTRYTTTPTSLLSIENLINGSLFAKSGNISFTITSNQADKAVLDGTINWNPTAVYYTHDNNAFAENATLDLTKLKLDFTSATTAEALSTGTAMTLIGGGKVSGTITQPENNTFAVTYQGNNATYNANLSGSASLTDHNLLYTLTDATVTGIQLNKVTDTADTLPNGWTVGNTAIDVDTSNLTLPTNLAAGTTKDIFSVEGASYNLTGSNVFDTATTPLSTGENGVALKGTKTGGGVRTKANATSTLEYVAPADNINQAAISEITWANNGTLLDASGSSNNFAGLTASSIDLSSLKLTNPQEAASGSAMTLIAANNTLTDFAAVAHSMSYTTTPVSGVNVNATITGQVSAANAAVRYAITGNQATQLTFGTVEWKNSGALLDHNTTMQNVDFSTAKVSTDNISFTGVNALNTNDSMTLVQNFGTASGVISGTAYTLGDKTGEGHAYLKNNNLLYLITQGTTQNGSGNEPGNEPGNISKDDAIKENGTATNQTIEGDVSGGTAQNNGVAQHNVAAVTGSTVTKDVYGATSVKGATTDNTAQVADSQVNGNVYGTYSDSGTAIGNTTTINQSTVSGDVAGAYSKSGTVSNGNTATVKDTAVSGNVYGGKSDNGEVNLSTTAISGGSVTQAVYGGYSETGDTSQNKVEVTDNAQITGNIYGGFTETGNTEANTVEIKGNATLDAYVYGGKSLSGTSRNNAAHVEDATIVGIIGGGCDEADGNTASFAAGTATNNIYGANATTTAKDNTVNITGGTVQGSVYGVYAGKTVTGNTVNLSGGTILGNSVTDTTNEVALSLAGGIYGGYVGDTSGTVDNNTVNLYGTSDISSAALYGANLSTATGNVLNIGFADSAANTFTPWTGGGQKVADIANFNTINFQTVPWSTTTPAVTISNGTNSNLANTKISAANVYFTGDTTLTTGSKMTLLDESKVAADKQLQAGNLTTASTYTVGTGLQGSGTLSLDDTGNVIYTVESVGVSEQAHNVLMGQTAVLSNLVVSNDYMEDTLEGLAIEQNKGQEGLAIYANMGGGTMRQHTGSYINSNSWNGVLGLGTKHGLPQGSIEYGAFVEHGYAKYSTHNGAHYGNGTTKYTGGGILAKWTTKNDLYLEGSVKSGRVKDNASGFLQDALGNTYGYNTRSEYHGAHLGIGKVFKYHNDAQLDVYGKYFYTLKKGTSFDAGGHYDLDNVKSSLMRIGARYTKHGRNFDYYAGLAYEHEFDGQARGTYNGLAIRSADVKGGSARLELGAKLTPNERSPWGLDINLTGYAGQKRGLSGSVSAVFQF